MLWPETVEHTTRHIKDFQTIVVRSKGQPQDLLNNFYNVVITNLLKYESKKMLVCQVFLLNLDGLFCQFDHIYLLYLLKTYFSEGLVQFFWGLYCIFLVGHLTSFNLKKREGGVPPISSNCGWVCTFSGPFLLHLTYPKLSIKKDRSPTIYF